ESLVNFKFIEGFLHKIIDPSWNSPQITQYVKDGNKKQRDELDAVWVFPLGTPLRSETWCKKAHRVASRALNRSQLYSQNWFDDIFTLHVSRMVLMLSDHYFSSIQGRVEYRDSAYKPIANTDRKTGQPKQRLDEHLIGVYRNAHSLSRMLPALRTLLPAITRHPGFKRRSADKRFQWQDKAFDLAVTLNERSHNQGFFGVNLASTGCGKTFANARIMYALADSRLGCRFSVALGLRTLTLQTGDAFREKLKLDEDDLAVLVGSAAVRALHEENYKASDTGSESSAELLEEDCYVSYEGALSDGALKHWLEQSPKLNRLVSAPVLVSTIDHLMPATEGTRGGKQIAPMLRLLSSDLVLDEPDDFGLDDIPALCRLVHWAGLLGARVLMSSATLSPGIVSGLFTAYQSGREKYQEACGELNPRKGVCCAWFDEWGCEAIDASDTEVYLHQHNQFVQKRIDKLESEVPLRKAKILTVDIKSKTKPDIINAVSEKIHHGVGRLHKLH
ncbi:MAG: type I-F CRISPR-associated helicase Cas3f, partial [Ketobacter sp.]